ncbi:MAG: hypothetical protein U1E36_02345 [Rickettsiales bacterium]
MGGTPPPTDVVERVFRINARKQNITFIYEQFLRHGSHIQLVLFWMNAVTVTKAGQRRSKTRWHKK